MAGARVVNPSDIKRVMDKLKRGKLEADDEQDIVAQMKAVAEGREIDSRTWSDYKDEDLIDNKRG